MQTGTIAATIANVYRKKGASPLTWRDFFPKSNFANATADDLLAKIVAINAALGGEDLREREGD